ncbi:MAG: Maf family protein [Pseudomonadota bacterium]
MPDYTLILASTSPFRKTLLERLGVDFRQVAPYCDETPLPDEPAEQLVARLAIEKARSVYDKLPAEAIVIGSDQVAVLDDNIIGKPHTHDAAVTQLTQLSGNTVMFHTGLCVMTAARQQQTVVSTEVKFKTLGAAQIERYLNADQPYGCAASFKSESMGSAIVDYMRSDDPSALIGLPLITVGQYLGELGVDVP